MIDKLKKNYHFFHLGLITISIKGLRRKGLGTRLECIYMMIVGQIWENLDDSKYRNRYE